MGQQGYQQGGYQQQQQMRGVGGVGGMGYQQPGGTVVQQTTSQRVVGDVDVVYQQGNTRVVEEIPVVQQTTTTRVTQSNTGGYAQPPVAVQVGGFIGGGLIQRAQQQPFRLTSIKHRSPGQLFMSADKDDGDHIIEFRPNMYEQRSLFQLVRVPVSNTGMSFFLRHVDTGANVFVSYSTKDGDWMVEARIGIDEERSRFHVIHDGGAGNLVILTTEDGKTLFASNDTKNGDHVMEAKHTAIDRSLFALDFP